MATLADTRIEVSASELVAGVYTVSVTNTGTEPHALQVSGPGLVNTRTPALTRGQTGILTVTLEPGAYELFCPVGDHKDRGMDLTVGVDPAGETPLPTPSDTTVAPHGGGH